MAGILYDPNNPLGLIDTAIPMPHPSLGGIPTAVPLPPIMPTLGQRNNNYGNLRTTDAFLGKTGSNSSYDTYETPEMGLRALARVLDTYSTKHGINTIDALVNRYAPASDNTGGSHENYKKFLSQQLGIGINDPVDVRGRRAEIMDAIIRFENKNRALATQDQIQQAILAADSGSSSPVGETKMVEANGTLSLEDDYKIGIQYNPPYFVYDENYRRYEQENGNKRNEALLNLLDEVNVPMNQSSGVLSNYPDAIMDGRNPQNQLAQKPSIGILEDDPALNNPSAPVPSNYPDAIMDGRNPQNQKLTIANPVSNSFMDANPFPEYVSGATNNQKGILEDGKFIPSTGNSFIDAVPEGYVDSTLSETPPYSGYNNAQVLRPFINDPSINQAQPNIGILQDDPSLFTDPSQLHANEFMGIETPNPNGRLDTKMLPASGYRNYIQNVGNRRDKTEMSLSPQPISPNIDTNEMLIRVGLAGVGGSQRGGLQALSDMGSTYGAIQDANRASGLEAYKASLRNKPDAPKDNSDVIEKIAQMDQVLLDFDRAKAYLNEGDITGPIDYGFFGYWDMAVGNENQNARLLLQKLRVDYTLLQIAQTKGAISNEEMKLFLSPAPSLKDQESVWIDWIDKRQKAVKSIRDRLANGVVLPEGQVASANQVEQFNKPTVEVSSNVKAAREALKQ